MKNYLFIALSIGLSFLAFMAFQQAKPISKAPIYKEVQKYSPYYVDKRFGGLQIMSKEDKEFKEKPTNMDFFHRLEFLEKTWGKEHLTIVENRVIVKDNNGSQIATIDIIHSKDRNFMHTFYGI